MNQGPWQEWIAAFPARPEIAADPYLYARQLVRACNAPLPRLQDLDSHTRIELTTLLQSAVIDLLRIQNHTAPNTAPSAISIALATFVAILFPDILPYVAIGQILLALWLVGQEQNLRELKRAINAAQARIDVLLVTLD